MTCKRPRRAAPCVYCGASQAGTLDHVPPSCLFPSPRPSDLITVPSCRSCNLGASLDDEYFKAVVVMNSEFGTSSAVRRLRPSVERSFQRSGFVQGLLKRASEEDQAQRRNRGSAAYEVDSARLALTVRRIVLGLYYHHTGHCLAPNAAVRVCLGRDPSHSVAADWPAGEWNSGTSISQADVFAYRFRLKAPHCVSFWTLRFFESLYFGCLTAPADEMKLNPQRAGRMVTWQTDWQSVAGGVAACPGTFAHSVRT